MARHPEEINGIGQDSAGGTGPTRPKPPRKYSSGLSATSPVCFLGLDGTEIPGLESDHAVWNCRQAMKIIADIIAVSLGLSISEIGQMLDWRGLNPLRAPEEADHHSSWKRAMNLHTEEKLRRNERGSIILTSNQGFGEWARSWATLSSPRRSWTGCCTTAVCPRSGGKATGSGRNGSPGASVRITCSALPRERPRQLPRLTRSLANWLLTKSLDIIWVGQF